MGTNSLVAAAPFAQPTPDAFGADSAAQLSSILDGAREEWPGILDSKMMPGFEAYLGQLPADMPPLADNPAVANEMSAWREEYLNERRQELVGVPDAVTSQLRTEMNELARRNGTSVADARDAAQRMLDQGYKSWAGRANLIARTEVMSANNNASLRAWRAMTKASGMGGFKTWVGGTRPTHSAVSGATIGLDEKFEVGDSEMDGPGDSAGGPSEVCNCACSLSFDLDDTTANGGIGDDGEGDESGGFGDEPDDVGGEGDGADDGEGGDDGGEEPDEDAAASADNAEELDDEEGHSEFADDTDTDLALKLAKFSEDGDEAGMDKVLAELQAREDAEMAHPEPAPALTKMSQAAAQEAEYDRLLDSGVDPEEAFNRAYGERTEAERKVEIIQELRGQGYSGKGWEHMTQDVFQQEAERMYYVAETETRTHLLNAAGRDAGINPFSLFTGPESRARKYASDELKAFWQDKGRLTVDDVRAGLLGGKMRSSETAYWN